MKFDINNAPPTNAQISSEVQRLEANKPGQLKSLRIFSIIFLLVGILTSICCYMTFPSMLSDRDIFIYLTPFVIFYHLVFLSQAFLTSHSERFLLCTLPVTVALAIYLQPFFKFTFFEITTIAVVSIYGSLGLIFLIKYLSPFYKTLRSIESLSEVDDYHILDIAKFIEVPEIKNYVDAIAALGRKITLGEHGMLKDQFYYLMHRTEAEKAKAKVFSQSKIEENN